MPPPFGRQLWGLPSRLEYLSPQGVLLPLVYGTTASPLWLELRGHSSWQATPSSTVGRLACHRLLRWLWVTFAMVPDAAWPGSDQWPWSTAPATGPVGRLGRPSASDPWGVGFLLSLGHPTCVQCPGPLGSSSPVCPRGLLCCVCGVLGHLAPVHRCARSVCCFACAVSWATWLLFTGVPARCVVLRVRCPGPLGSCSPVCPLGVLFCVCRVLGHLAPVHRCACSVCCVTRPSALPAVSSSVFPLLLSFRRLVLLCFFLGGGGGGWLGCGVFGAVRGCGCVLVPVLVWAWVSWGTGVGWLSRSGFPVCAPAPRLPVSRAPVQGGADGGWLAAVVAWRLRGWSRLLGSAWVAWLVAGVRVGVSMAWADGVVGSVGLAGLCGCRACVRRRRSGLGWGTVDDAMGGGDAGDAYGGGGAVGVETGWCC